MSQSGNQNHAKTIKQPVSFTGKGIHSGRESTVVVKPAAPGTGIVFFLQGKKIVAKIKNVTDSERATTLSGLSQVEHLLAAIYSLGLTNVEIVSSGPEIPILDGSCLPFVFALEKVGYVEQKEIIKPIDLIQPIEVCHGDQKLVALPASGLSIDYFVDYPVIGQQSFSFDGSLNAFKKDLAPARTFGYKKDLETLQKSGLALGATLECALGIGPDGYLNKPRFSNEPVRHKVLDLLGDLALLERPLNAKIKANKSSHSLNHELVRRLVA